VKLVNKVQIQQQGCCLEEEQSKAQPTDKISRGVSQLETFALGYDELNLAEFPLAAIADRHPSGEKTNILTDTVWDRAAKKHLPRRLMISGTDLYGLTSNGSIGNSIADCRHRLPKDSIDFSTSVFIMAIW